MTIEQLITEAHLEICYGEIHLGIANGWGAATKYAYRILTDYKVPNSGATRKLAKNYNENSFTVKDATSEYVVVYTVDSSD